MRRPANVDYFATCGVVSGYRRRRAVFHPRVAEMSVGSIVRAVLGDRAFRPLGRAYRRVFVDLHAVVDAIGALPRNAYLLDIGGGDGDVINLLLAKHPDCRVTMIDIADTVGGWIEPRFQDRVERRPKTDIRQFAAGNVVPDVVLVSDVVHHVPLAARERFVDDLAAVVGPKTLLVVKDVNPGGLRSMLALLADRYVTGDENVRFVPRDALRDMVARRLRDHMVQDSRLDERDAPNYLLKFVPRSI